jgi:hypothetical protein
LGRRDGAKPFDDDITDEGYEHDQEQPAEWPNFPSSWLHLGLLGNVEQLGLLLGEEQFEAPGTVHPRVAQDDEKIPLRQNPSLLRGELMATTWTSEMARLPLAERASRMATSRDFKILESHPSPVREDMSLAHPF